MLLGDCFDIRKIHMKGKEMRLSVHNLHFHLGAQLFTLAEVVLEYPSSFYLSISECSWIDRSVHEGWNDEILCASLGHLAPSTEMFQDTTGTILRE